MPHVDGHSDGEQHVFGSGLENFSANLGVAIPGIIKNIFSGSGGLIGGVAGGMAGSAITDMLGNGNGNACGCQPKVFIRMDKCGRPIITRKMKKQAIEAVNTSGAEAAAATLTMGNLELLTMITSKQFPP